MKTSLLLLGAALAPALVCETHDRVGPKASPGWRLLAAAGNTPAPEKQTTPAAPQKPAPKPANPRDVRRPRPEYLFL